MDNRHNTACDSLPLKTTTRRNSGKVAATGSHTQKKIVLRLQYGGNESTLNTAQRTEIRQQGQKH
jgi:hypothetical protein